MEDTVVRDTWLASVAAVVIIAGLAAQSALGGPATTTWWHELLAPDPPTAMPQATADPAMPSSQIAPLEHPVKYLTATMSELPIASSLGLKAKPAADHPTPPDAISLQTPVGPPSPQLFISLAQMSEREGNIEQARSQYKHALAMWPDNIDVLRSAARMEDRLGNLQWAEYLYQKAAAANPRHPGVLNDLGLCLARQGKLEQSVQTIDKALYRNNAATVLVELRQDQRAVAHLAAVHSPAEASYNMGQLLVQRGRADEAEPYFVAALQQDPKLREAELALAKLRGEIAAQEPVATAEQTPAPPATVDEGPQLAPQPDSQPTVQAPAAAPPAYPTYLPPTYERVPTAVYPTPVQSSVSAAPRHLPPVGALPGVVAR
jgi:tetratricopeptide (TPR) repeat protein